MLLRSRNVFSLSATAAVKTRESPPNYRGFSRVACGGQFLSPIAWLPDPRLNRAGPDTALGIDAHGLLQMRHRAVAVAGGMQQVSQVIVQRRLVVAVALGGAERKGRFGERASLFCVAARGMYKRQIVQRCHSG